MWRAIGLSVVLAWVGALYRALESARPVQPAYPKDQYGCTRTYLASALMRCNRENPDPHVACLTIDTDHPPTCIVNDMEP